MSEYIPLEHYEQVAVVNWLDAVHPEIVFFSVPNGAKLGGSHAQRMGMVSKLKSEGLTPGAPDLVILKARGGWHGCLLEMKRRKKGSAVSENQRELLARAEREGYYTIVAHGSDEAIELLSTYFSWEGV